MKEEKRLYFGDPNNKRTFHIFDEEKKSLCGGWSMPFTQFDDEDLVKGTENCRKDDCKRCFEKLKAERK